MTTKHWADRTGKYTNRISGFAYSWCIETAKKMERYQNMDSYKKEILISELESTFLLHEQEFKVTLTEVYPLLDKYEQVLKLNSNSPNTKDYWATAIIGLFILAGDIFVSEKHRSDYQVIVK